jgi:hypothetical protein
MKEALAVLFLIMQALDGLTTYVILKQGGRELNPFMQIAMNFLGVLPALILVKMIVIAVFAVYFEFIPAWAWLLVIGVYGYVLFNNFKVLEDMDKLK